MEFEMCNLNKPITRDDLASLLQNLRDGFASRSDEFFRIMGKTILDSSFTKIQVQRGIKKTIKECPYSQLSISSVFQACKESNPERLVEYQRESPSGSMENVVFPESVYISDLSTYRNDTSLIKLIKYIEE